MRRVSISKCNSLVCHMNTLRKGSHSVFMVHLHIVFVTKYRRDAINDEILTRLREIFSYLCQTQECELVEFSGETDHVHLLVDFSPKISISELVRTLKSASSRLIRKEFSEHLNKIYWKPVFWHHSYCVLSSGGAPLEVLKQYIKGHENNALIPQL